MAIGNQVTPTLLNQQAGQTAIAIRNACRQAQALNEYVTTIGGSSALQSLGFSATDATNFITAANYMQTVAGLFFGTATQGTVFNFDNAISILYGGL